MVTRMFTATMAIQATIAVILTAVIMGTAATIRMAALIAEAQSTAAVAAITDTDELMERTAVDAATVMHEAIQVVAAGREASAEEDMVSVRVDEVVAAGGVKLSFHFV